MDFLLIFFLISLPLALSLGFEHVSYKFGLAGGNCSQSDQPENYSSCYLVAGEQEQEQEQEQQRSRSRSNILEPRSTGAESRIL